MWLCMSCLPDCHVTYLWYAEWRLALQHLSLAKSATTKFITLSVSFSFRAQLEGGPVLRNLGSGLRTVDICLLPYAVSRKILIIVKYYEGLRRRASQDCARRRSSFD